MIKLKNYLILLLLPLMAACFSDESTDATKQLSTIVIESGIDSIYNIGKNDTILITPVISQDNEEKELRYVWEVDLKEVAYDKDFAFVGKSLGKYNCRLIVENEDGKTFFPFTVFVNSPYEEGITILSKDDKGNSMLSFMQKPYGEEKGKFFAYDCFAVNNPDDEFAAGAVDMVQCRDAVGSGGWVIIACQGGGENNDAPTIYYLNEKTFEIENSIKVTGYDDFKPVKMGLTPVVYQQTSYPILCENGKVYDFSTGEADIIKPRKLQSTYSPSCVVTRTSTSYEILLWDKINQGLSLIYNGYGPYYCSEKKYHLMLSEEGFDKNNFFAGSDFITMTNIRMTPEHLAKSGNRSELLIITSYMFGMFAESRVIYSDFWGYNAMEEEESMRYPMTVESYHDGDWDSSTPPLTAETPCIANKTYTTLHFAKGNKVYAWDYASVPTDMSGLLSPKEFCSVGSDDAIITGFELSDDHKKLYVSYYEPKQQGLNGSLAVFHSDEKGPALEEYKNISYQAVKMIYKKK